MPKRFFVSNFRKNAPLRERAFGNFIFLTGKLPVVPRPNLLTERDRENAQKKLNAGDLVFVGSAREISQFFVRGVFSHVLIYTGDEKLIHSNLKHGVTKIHFDDLFAKYDYLSVYRPRKVTPQQTRKVIKFAKKALGTAYDFRFLEENKKELYCTKLVYLAYQKAGIELKHSLTSNCLSYFSITHPADFIMHNFTQIFSSESCLSLKVMKTKRRSVRAMMMVAQFFMAWSKIW